MEWSMAGEIEELVVCACCKRAYDDERPPKLLACQHSFCVACVRGVLARGRGLACLHGCRRAELRARDALPTHGALLALARRLGAGVCGAHARPALWCCVCAERACRACERHAAHAHALRPPAEARAQLARDARQLRAELARLAARRRDVLLRALDAAAALKARLEAELASPLPVYSRGGEASLASAADERERLRARLAARSAQARLDELVRGARAPLAWELLRRALGAAEPPPPDARDPLLFLANYCTAQLCARHLSDVPGADEADAASASPSDPAGASPASPAPLARAFPLFYFDLEVDGAAAGRVVIEVRSDVAPRMARNFGVLATGELGVGYRGCAVFQCWDGESVITGDFELNNGRGGRSAFSESHFMPDDTRLAAVRGAVGMRRSQRRRDTLGLVGSQFRIVLREMRGFTAIFAAVVEGLELVDRLSRAGDSAGKPGCAILIAGCGKLN